MVADMFRARVEQELEECFKNAEFFLRFLYHLESQMPYF